MTQITLLRALKLRYSRFPTKFYRTFELGGLQGSSHTRILSALVKKDLVAVDKSNPNAFSYQISKKGLEFLSEVDAAVDIPDVEFQGGLKTAQLANNFRITDPE